MADNRISYVYMLFRPNGLPCYVGKGVRGRWCDHERAGANHINPHLARIFKAAGGPIPRVKVRTGLTDAEACKIEIALIAAIGRGRKGHLVNLTDGGDGQRGWVPSEKTRERIRQGNTGKTASAETRAKMSMAGKGKTKSAEHKRKIGAAHKGKIIKPEVLALQKKRVIERFKDPLERRKVADWHASMTPEQKKARSEKISKSLREHQARKKAACS